MPLVMFYLLDLRAFQKNKRLINVFREQCFKLDI